jgi:hypothetical protein
LSRLSPQKLKAAEDVLAALADELREA